MSRAKRNLAAAPAPPLVLFVGDLHVGGTTAVAPKAECRNAEMERLLAVWLAFVERAKAAAKGTAFVLALGGDLIDQPRHHNTFQTWGTTREQRNAAIELLQPLANLASDVIALKGTETHAGADGEDDQTVAEALGVKRVPYVWRMVIGGQRVLWSHHGLSVARDPWNAANGMYAMARRLAQRRDPPDLAVFHHVHQMPRPVTAYGVTVAAVGCWQSSTAYGFRFRPEQPTDIGPLCWKPGAAPEPWPYPHAETYQEFKAAQPHR